MIFQTFLGVVSDLLEVSNVQNTQTPESEGDEHPGTTLLETLDKFALRAFNITLGIIANDNTSKL